MALGTSEGYALVPSGPYSALRLTPQCQSNVATACICAIGLLKVNDVGIKLY